MGQIHNFPEGFEAGGDRFSQLTLIEFILEKYERLEILSLLEQLLWSKKLDESDTKNKDDEMLKRQAYRVNCGADIVISNILPYLGNDNEESEKEEKLTIHCWWW